jgi:hypothetical protein
MDLDIWRYVTYNKGTESNHRGHVLFEKEDFTRLRHLPVNWWYYFNNHGEGRAIDFPLKAKPVLSWSPAHFFKKDGKLCLASRFPMEKISITIVKRACDLDNID